MNHWEFVFGERNRKKYVGLPTGNCNWATNDIGRMTSAGTLTKKRIAKMLANKCKIKYSILNLLSPSWESFNDGHFTWNRKKEPWIEELMKVKRGRRGIVYTISIKLNRFDIHSIEVNEIRCIKLHWTFIASEKKTNLNV